MVVDKNPALLKPWRAEVARVARATWVHRSPIDGPVQVLASFVLPKPKRVKREHPHVRPDVDKLLRALLDGITDAGVVWGDDAQVTRVETEKVYGVAPGVHVVISRVAEKESAAVGTAA